MIRITVLGLLLVPCFVLNLSAQIGAAVPGIKAIKDVRPLPSVFNIASRKSPIAIHSKTEASKYFSMVEADRLVKQVDFKNQLVLVFAWRGSGQDRQEYVVMESYPEQIRFSIKPGRTRDLRPHTYVYALRKNVSWNGEPANVADEVDVAAEYIKVEVKGKLNSQIFAIGGETTGVQISANGVVWELELGRDAALRKTANELNEKQVVVTGTLTVKSGVEINKRWIVKVAALRDAAAARGGGTNATASDNAYLNAAGSLQHPIVLRDSQSGFAGNSGTIWTIEANGAWRSQTFLNANVRMPEHEGRFTKEQLATLARHLAQRDLLGLPDSIGVSPNVNPHTISVSFGKKECRRSMIGGGALSKVDVKNAKSPEQRFAAVVRLLQNGMKQAE